MLDWKIKMFDHRGVKNVKIIWSLAIPFELMSIMYYYLWMINKKNHYRGFGFLN